MFFCNFLVCSLIRSTICLKEDVNLPTSSWPAASTLSSKLPSLILSAASVRAESGRVIRLIKRKLDGKKLSEDDMNTIIEDIVANKLTSVEITYFVAAGYTKGLDMDETVALTKAMINTGKVLKVDHCPIVDKHCIGGVAGNRTTMILVPILIAAGYCVPKTSSRSITSPAGVKT